MAEKVVIYKKDEVHVVLKGERSALREVYEHFSFQIPNARFNPKVKNRIWDGYIRLLNLRTGEFYIGLVPALCKFLIKSGYEIDIDKDLNIFDTVTDETLDELIETLEIPFEPRDYQYDAVKYCLENSRATVLSPTGSGKSFIQFLIASYYRAKNLRTLLIVPTQNLVMQMEKDFVEYSKYHPVIQKIMGGETKEIHPDAEVCVSTWQSIFRFDEEFFDQFDVIMIDEYHLATASSIKAIMENCTKAKYKFGFTGTLKETKTDKMVLIGLTGPVFEASTTKELMDRDFISKLKIHPVLFSYSKEIVKAAGKLDYQKELSFLIGHEKRNQGIIDLILELKGNTLVLFERVEKHGQVLYDLLTKQTDRKVYFIHGGIDKDEREEVREIMEKNEGVIVVASSGVFSTGINIRKLNNLILASLGKSKIKVLQSIGRTLRLHDSKDYAHLYDLSDDLRGGKKRLNYSLRHFMSRMEIYNDQGFVVEPVKVIQIE